MIEEIKRKISILKENKLLNDFAKAIDTSWQSLANILYGRKIKSITMEELNEELDKYFKGEYGIKPVYGVIDVYISFIATEKIMNMKKKEFEEKLGEIFHLYEYEIDEGMVKLVFKTNITSMKTKGIFKRISNKLNEYFV